MSRIYGICLLAVTTTSTACLMTQPGPKSGAVASGAQLNVVDDVKVWTTKVKEKVAETEYTDSNGNSLGKGTTYTEKDVTHTQKIWYPVQGTEQLSDEDFFKIAGDQKAYDETIAMRADGRKWRRRGIGTMIGGGVGVIASFLVPAGTLRLGLSALGGLAVGGGYYMTWHGASEMNPATHAVDRSVADRAANQYNVRLPNSISMGKTF